MKCSECGLVLPAMKTVRWFGEDDEWELCDDCLEEVEDEVVIVPGEFAVWGFCRLCGGWHSLNELQDVRGGGRWDAPTGTCSGCAGREGAVM